jgi:hypothetical protein|tara:strand:+ start:253 stop:432 length:180 start_codon:yes stop_codon:yes gene_type:complete
MAKSSLIVIGIVLIIIGALLRSGLIQWLLDFMGILLLIIGGITLIVGLVQMITGRSKGY